MRVWAKRECNIYYSSERIDFLRILLAAAAVQRRADAGTMNEEEIGNLGERMPLVSG